MNVLINLISIKKGGGQQVATNFVEQITRINGVSVVFLVTNSTLVHLYLRDNLKIDARKIINVKDSHLHRLVFISTRIDEIIINYNIDIIYTLFGPGLHSRRVKSVTGCAYSNLFYPEINFWKDYNMFVRIKKELIDLYRMKSLLKSDAIIFENASMQSIAISRFNYPKEKTKLILPSIPVAKRFDRLTHYDYF